eukprot:CAMPEP_0201946166 /NCGR_PEP_ID=MMETSP0903-20130614/54280_1 /ASSEMBLY_ACC=CAM_ASM_000552 /TAXON_ID=420261 /ORGANISM="Thalassiosira antarctica, Strain CCMP982" /LENGTH=834 /DNA_ID=CAMNT_0048489259 /DNA_START=64 /DNA_END=2564 /DNA_ORIENTATION=-
MSHTTTDDEQDAHPNGDGDPPTDDEKDNARHNKNNNSPGRRASAKSSRNPTWSDSLESCNDSNVSDDEETCLRTLTTMDTKNLRRLREDRREAKGITTSGGNEGSSGNNTRGKGGKGVKGSDTETTRNGNNRGKGGKGSDTEITRNSHRFESSNNNSHNRFVEKPSSSNNNSSSRRRHNIHATSIQSSQASNIFSHQSSQASNSQYSGTTASHQSSQASNSQYSGTTASSEYVIPLNGNQRSSRNSSKRAKNNSSSWLRCYLPWQLLLLSSLGFVTMVRLGFIDFRLEGNQLKQLRFLRGAQDYLPGRNGDDGTTLETHFETHEEDFGNNSSSWLRCYLPWQLLLLSSLGFVTMVRLGFIDFHLEENQDRFLRGVEDYLPGHFETHEEDFGIPNIGDSSEWGIESGKAEKEKLRKLESALEALDTVEGIDGGGGIEYSKAVLPAIHLSAPVGIGGEYGGASQQYNAVSGSQQYNGAAPVVQWDARGFEGAPASGVVVGEEYGGGTQQYMVQWDARGFEGAPASGVVVGEEYGGGTQQYNAVGGNQQYRAALVSQQYGGALPPPSLSSDGVDHSNSILPPPGGGGVVQAVYGGGNQGGYNAVPASGSQQYGAAVPATPLGIGGEYGGASQQYGAVGGNAPIAIVQSPEYSNAILPPNGGVVPGDVGGFGAAPAPVGTAGGEYGSQQYNAQAGSEQYGGAPVIQGDAGGFGGAPPASGIVVGEEYGGGTQQYGQQYGAVGGNTPIAIVQSQEYSNAILPPNGGVVQGDVGGFGAALAPVGVASVEYGSQQYNAQAGSEQYGAAPVIQGDAGGFGGAPPASGIVVGEEYGGGTQQYG